MEKQERPAALAGMTYEIPCGCGPVYVTCNDQGGRLFEVFARLGKSGGCGSATSEAVGKLVSIALRSGADPEQMCKGLAGVQCHKFPSCLDAVASAMRSHLEGLCASTVQETE